MFAITHGKLRRKELLDIVEASAAPSTLQRCISAAEGLDTILPFMKRATLSHSDETARNAKRPLGSPGMSHF